MGTLTVPQPPPAQRTVRRPPCPQWCNPALHIGGLNPDDTEPLEPRSWDHVVFNCEQMVHQRDPRTWTGSVAKGAERDTPTYSVQLCRGDELFDGELIIGAVQLDVSVSGGQEWDWIDDKYNHDVEEDDTYEWVLGDSGGAHRVLTKRGKTRPSVPVLYGTLHPADAVSFAQFLYAVATELRPGRAQPRRRGGCWRRAMTLTHQAQTVIPGPRKAPCPVWCDDNHDDEIYRHNSDIYSWKNPSDIDGNDWQAHAHLYRGDDDSSWMTTVETGNTVVELYLNGDEGMVDANGEGRPELAGYLLPHQVRSLALWLLALADAADPHHTDGVPLGLALHTVSVPVQTAHGPSRGPHGD